MTAPAHHATAEPEPAAERPDRAVDLLVASTGVLTGIAMSGLAPVLPAIEATLGRGAASGGYLVKLVVAVVGLAVMISAPLSGRIARRYRCGDIVALCFTAYAAAALASALAPSLAWLVAARFVQGVAVAIGVTMLLTIAGTLYPPHLRDRLLGLHMGTSAIVLLAVLPLAGALGDISWRLAPLVGLVSLGHLGLALKARRVLDFHLAPAATGAPRSFDGDERRQAVITAALAFLIGVAIYSGPAFLPFKLVEVGLGTGKAIGLISTVATACSALGSLAYPQVTARFSRRIVYAIALSCCISGALLLAVANSGGAVIGAQVVSGGGSGLLLAHIYGDCAQRFSTARRAFGTGLVKASSFAGLFVGPLLLQALVARFAIDAAFVATASVLGIALAVALLGRAPRPLQGESR